MKAHKKNFTGLPIPAAATAAVSGNLILHSDEFQSLFAISEKLQAWLLIVMLVVLGYFMVSRWKFPSLKTLHIRAASFQIVILTVLTAALIFYGLISHFALVFFAFTWGYLLVAWTLSLIRLISGRKSKTLEDFEPDPDDNSGLE